MLSTPVLDADSNAVKVNTLILSTDGNYSLNGGDDGRVELRDAWTLDLLHTFPKVRFVKFKNNYNLFQKVRHLHHLLVADARPTDLGGGHEIGFGGRLQNRLYAVAPV